MNTANFAEEFTQLVVRWTTPATNGKDSANLDTSLTNEQLVNTVHDVLKVILGMNFETDYSSVKTPATVISICTPNAPMVLKAEVSREETNGTLSRFRSLDALITPKVENNNLMDSDSYFSKRQDNFEINENDDLKPLPEDKKFISRSSPAIHVCSVTRSETFIRENEEKETRKRRENSADPLEKFADDFSYDPEKINIESFFKKLEALRKSAFEVVTKIDDVKKEVYPQTTKPIRRLSSIGFPGLARSSTMMRPIPPPKLRRSTTGFPGTPTSSKLNTTITAEKNNNSSRRKTICSAATQMKTKGHLLSSTNRSPSVTVSTTRKSPSNVTSLSAKKSPSNAISVSNKISPTGIALSYAKSPLEHSGGRPAKNPKYAHVQSTIPKGPTGKRKAQ